MNIAPVYYALGNNEYEAKLFKDSNITKDLKVVGVHVLDDASEIVDIKDTKLNIGGLSQGPRAVLRDMVINFLISILRKITLNFYWFTIPMSLWEF